MAGAGALQFQIRSKVKRICAMGWLAVFWGIASWETVHSISIQENEVFVSCRLILLLPMILLRKYLSLPPRDPCNLRELYLGRTLQAATGLAAL